MEGKSCSKVNLHVDHLDGGLNVCQMYLLCVCTVLIVACWMAGRVVHVQYVASIYSPPPPPCAGVRGADYWWERQAGVPHEARCAHRWQSEAALVEGTVLFQTTTYGTKETQVCSWVYSGWELECAQSCHCEER